MARSQKTKMLERSLRVALSNALAISKKLRASVEDDDGDVYIAPFLTLERHQKIVRRVYAENEADKVRLILSMHDPVLRRIADFAVSAHRAEKQADQRRRADPRVVEDAGDVADGIIRASKKRRNEEEE